jgi:hypothetical protein
MNKARVGEPARGTYPIGIALARKAEHVDLVRKNQEKWYSSLNGTRKPDNVTRWSL